VLTDLEGLALWQSEFLAKRIVEAKPEEALKRGWALECDDKDAVSGMAKLADELDLDETLIHATQMSRACGGSAIFPVIDGAQGRLADPLDEEAIGAITALLVFEPRELRAVDWHRDLGPKWGRPSLYSLYPLPSGGGSYLGGEAIHESRLIILPGRKISRERLPGQRDSWGDSCLTPVAEVLADFGVSWGSAATLLQHHGKETLQIAGLQNMLSHADGMEEFDRTLSAMYAAWSTLRMNVIDAGSSITRSTGTLAGVHELLAEFKELVAAAAETPMAQIFGTAGAGLRTGDADTEAWHSTCERWRTKTMARPHRALVRLLMLSSEGPTNGVEPDRWSVAYPPMGVPSDKEIAETRKIDMDRAAVAVLNGIVSADDVAESFFGGERYSGEIRVDWERRKAQADLDMEEPDDVGADAELEPDDDELDDMALEDEEDITLDDDEEEDDLDESRTDAAAKGSSKGRGKAIVRASDGRFGHVAGVHKGKRAPKFDDAPHRKVIDAHRASEAKHRKASLAIKDRMLAVRAAAVGKSKAVRAKAKEKLSALATKRDGFRAKANEARTARIAASKGMAAARKEHAVKVREERAKAKTKTTKTTKTTKPTEPENPTKPEKPAKPEERALMTDEAVKVNEAAKVGDVKGVHLVMDSLIRERYGLEATKLDREKKIDTHRGEVTVKPDSEVPAGFLAYRNWNGEIVIPESSKVRMQQGAKVAENIRIGDAVEHTSREIKRLSDKYAELYDLSHENPNPVKKDELMRAANTYATAAANARERLPSLKDAENELTTMMHETLHGFSPMHGAAYRGIGAKIEEITTEVSARVIMSKSFGSKLIPSTEGSYNRYISSAVVAIQLATGKSREEAYGVLQEASLAFKRRAGSSLASHDEVKTAFVEDIAVVIGEHGPKFKTDLRFELQDLEDLDG
jgi:phage-related protein (TIGR01555 family)